MRCKYCFYCDVADNRKIKSYGLMSEKTLETLVKKTLEYADGTASFGFQGGEPTLAGLDFYKKLVDYQKKYNIKNINIINTIQTNGYLIDEDYAKFFGENKFLVGLSLDGPQEMHDSLRIDSDGNGTFSKVINASKLFDKFNVEYNILCVINNFNARYPNKLYNFYKKNNFKYLQFIPLINDFDSEHRDYSLSPKRYSFFLNILFDNYYNDFIKGNYVSIRTFDNYIKMLMGYPPECCGMSGICSYNLVIEGDGSIFPCDFYVLDRYKLGNIYDNSFSEIKNSEIAKNFIKESDYIDKKCRDCKWFNICRGGCRRYREPFVYNKPSLNIYCESFKEFFEHSFERMLIMSKQILNSQK